MDEPNTTRKIFYRQLLCVLPINCVYFMIGLQRGWIAPVLKAANEPHSELPLTTEQSSWMASLPFITRGLSPILCSFVLDKVGRNRAVVFAALISFGIWIAVYWSREIFVHYVLRLAVGFGDGVMDVVAGIYVCENCSPNFRGTLYGLTMLFLFAGHLLVFILAAYCSYSTIAVTYAVFGLVTVLSMLLLVEPPHYFLMKGETAKAENSFKRLRNMSDPLALSEFEAMKKNIAEEKSSRQKFNLKLFRSRQVYKSLRMLLLIMLTTALCGYPVMIAFVTTLFSSGDGMSASHLSMLYGVLQLICVAASSSILERFNRRTLMLVASISISLIHASTAAFYCLQSMYEIRYFNSLLFITLTIFSCLYAMFMFPLIGILRGELLPQSVKMVGAGICTFVLSFGSFISTRTFLPIAEAFGMEVNFAIFSFVALILAVFSYLYLPETRGKTLVEIQNELKCVKKESESGTD